MLGVDANRFYFVVHRVDAIVSVFSYDSTSIILDVFFDIMVDVTSMMANYRIATCLQVVQHDI